MRVGLVGSGNMARALARGWGEPVYCSDAGSGKAKALVKELGGGEAFSSNSELARAVDVVILAHKPAQLREVAVEIAPVAEIVISLLARIGLDELQAAYPDSIVFRVQPNLGVEVRKGVTVFVDEAGTFAARSVAQTEQSHSGVEKMDSASSDELTEIAKKNSKVYADVVALFERIGAVVPIAEKLLDAAAACSAVGPAYWALLVEAQVDAAVKRGLKAEDASILVTETMAASADLLRNRDYDTLALRREVASPGGTTIRGLAALESGGIRAAFSQAIDDVLKPVG